jgi:hypothetical protein
MYKDVQTRRNWHNKRRANVVSKILELKISCGKCMYCEYDEHPEILQFHHRNPSDKRIALSGGSIGNYSWESIQKEIDKCDLICPNCHFYLHYKEAH